VTGRQEKDVAKRISTLRCTPFERLTRCAMGILGKIFTWWDGATIGTMLDSALSGEQGRHRRAGQPLLPREEAFPRAIPLPAVNAAG
jgi:hypothetical protein